MKSSMCMEIFHEVSFVLHKYCNLCLRNEYTLSLFGNTFHLNRETVSLEFGVIQQSLFHCVVKYTYYDVKI